MKNKIPLFLAIFAIFLFVIPKITLAVWWNPVSWKFFNRKPEIKNEQRIVATSTPKSTTGLEKSTSSKTESFFDTNEKKINISSESSIKGIQKSKSSELKTEKSGSLEKKQEYTLPKNTGRGSVINGVTSGPRSVNSIASSASSGQTKKVTEEEKIIEIQKQIKQTKSQIEQMAAVSANWWRTAPSISTQTYFYQGVETKIFVLTSDGDYRIEFVSPESNQKHSKYLKDTQANLEKGELNKKIEQIINDNLGVSPAIAVIDGFLANPTIGNLRLFCDKAKTILGTEQKKVFNETRTDFIMKTLTLYEQSQINNLCNLAFGIRKLKSGEYSTESEFRSFFQWVIYDPSYILEFSPNDSDSIREIKINFNNEWKGLSMYKLIGFYVYSTSNEITTPNKVMENILIEAENDINAEELSIDGINSLIKLRQIPGSYVVPEKILTETRRLLIRK